MDWECLRTSAENNMGDGRSHAIVCVGGGGKREEVTRNMKLISV
jgi:hypothetical protein